MSDAEATPVALEPEFVGAGRAALVEGLLAAYDQVNTDGEPLWVSLEAPPGSGKTRVVREFYSRLAAERQLAPAYWPPSILGSQSDAPTDVLMRRKRVNPEVRHVPGSLPMFMWWGVTASTVHGTQTAALEQGIGILEDHRPYLDDVWRRLATWREQQAGRLREPGQAVLEEGVTHVAGEWVSSALGASVPGLGLVWPTAKAVVRGVKDRSARAERLLSDSEVTGSSATRLDEVALLLTRLARPGLPLVVVIEDAHDIDGVMAELLQQLIVSRSAVLIVTTSWLGRVESTEALFAAMQRGQDRVVRLSADDEVSPEGFASEASLAPLGADARETILRHYYPEVERETRRRLLELYVSPLAMELFCQLPAYRRRVDAAGVLTLSEANLRSLPATMEDLYRLLWRELPEPVRVGLTLASMQTPAMLDVGSTQSTWHAVLFQETLEALDPVEAWFRDDALQTADGVDSATWARSISDALRQFREHDQLRVAFDDDALLLAEDREAVLAAFAERVAAAVGDDTAERSDEELVQLARLAVGLHALGTLDDALASSAIADALEALADEPLELGTRLALGASIPGLDTVSLSNARALRAHRGTLQEAGKVKVLVPLSRRLVAFAEEREPDGSLEVWASRKDLASALESVGQLEEAIQLHSQVVAARVSALGKGHPSTLISLNHLAQTLESAGRLDEAIPILDWLAAGAVQALGMEHPDTLKSRNNLGTALTARGRLGEAITLYESLARDATRGLGADHSVTITIRHNLASALQAAARWPEAVSLLEVAVADAASVFGAAHPSAMSSRNSLALALQSAGRLDEAIPMFEELLVDRSRVLSVDHPHTLTSRNNLALALQSAGRLDEAIPMFEELLVDRSRVLSVDHPHTLTSRNNLALALSSGGRPNEAVPLFERVVSDRMRVLGVDHPQTLTSQSNLANSLLHIGRASEAVTLLKQVATGTAKVLGAEHPTTLDNRGSLANALRAAGHWDEAILVGEAALADMVRVLGAEHRHTLVARGNHAGALLAAKRREEAILLYQSLLPDFVRTFGADHPNTLATRGNLASGLRAAGRNDEADQLDK